MTFRLIGLLAFLIPHFLFSQTIGLTTSSSGSKEGLVLFSPNASKNTYLVDKCGVLNHSWVSSYTPGLSCFLQPDKTLYRTGKKGNTTFTEGGNGGVIERFDWDGNLLWQFDYSTNEYCQHHDIAILPNGNVLLISWEKKSIIDAVNAGRNPTLTGNSVWSEKIVEIKPVGANGGEVVWEWHAWDHLIQDFDNSKPNFDIVGNHPERINANYNAKANTEDWLHFNSVDYNSELDQIVISCHSFSEFWIIDHSTTTAQAATNVGGSANKGGDILYRWGNPSAYGKGAPGSRKFWGQHDAEWIPVGLPNAGSIMVFNNGNGRAGGNYSTIEIINPPRTGKNYHSNNPYLPANSDVIFNGNNEANIYAQNISGSQQLANGNVLVCDGPAGRFFELTGNNEIVWEYINPVAMGGPMSQGSAPSQNLVFRCEFYPNGYAGFGALSNLGTIENENSLSDACEVTGIQVYEAPIFDMELVPNPVQNLDDMQVRYMGDESFRGVLTIYASTGQLIHTQTNVFVGKQAIQLPALQLFAGVYLLQIEGPAGNLVSKRFVVR